MPKWLDLPSKILSTISLLGMILGAFWYFIDDEFSERLRDLVFHAKIQTDSGPPVTIGEAVEEMRVFRAEVRSGMIQLSQQILELDERISAVEPPITLVEWDELRTRVLEPCPIDTICTVQTRVRRTPAGRLCRIENIRRYVVDSLGVIWPVNLIPQDMNTPPINATEEGFVTIQRRFVLPDGAAEGAAEMFWVSDYTGCAPDAPQDTYRDVASPRIIFAIRRS